MKSHLSGSSSLPGHSQLMAEPSNSGGIQAPENFSKYKGSKVTFWPRPASTWVNLVYPKGDGRDPAHTTNLYAHTFHMLTLQKMAAARKLNLAPICAVHTWISAVQCQSAAILFVGIVMQVHVMILSKMVY